jgi:hypothetical protein
MKRTAYTQPQLPTMNVTLTFGGVVLSPMHLGRPCAGNIDLWTKYAEDGLDGPTLWDAGMDYDNREGRG